MALTNSERVTRWRKATKQRLIDAFGGKCGVCGYNRCNSALEFHHLDPNEKELHWGQMSGTIKGWDTIIVEMRKCVMLCSNCHREVHAGLVEIPMYIARFDESFADYKPTKDTHNECPICGTLKPIGRQTCSRQCGGKSSHRVNWSDIDVISLYEQYQNWDRIGAMFGVTGGAVHRRYDKVLRDKKLIDQ